MQSFVIPSSSPVPEPAANILVIKPETSIGIEDIRQIQTFLSTKPIKDVNKVYLLQAELLTMAAQNALLKTLEEPPGDSEVYLVTDQPEQLLPTVLSRVQVIAGPNKSAKPDVTYTSTMLQKVRTAKLGERLRILDEEKFTREQLLKFMTDVENIIHQDLSLAKLYPTVVQMKKYLKANCNLKLCLTFFAQQV